MATPQPGTPTRQNRLDAIEHVVYEYANLSSAGFYSMRGDAPWRTHADDAFLLGYRKLGDFLLNEYPRSKDDVLALDYLPAGSKRVWDLPTWQQEWRTHMNKQLTHVAYARVIAPREWNHLKWNPKLLNEFRVAWKAFLAAVTDKDFDDEFERQIDRCQAKPGFENIHLR
jgi:hypothetical protein